MSRKKAAYQSNPIPKLSIKWMLWNISIGQHGLSVWPCKKLEKVLDFIAATENISVVNILLTPNPKHSSY